MVARNHILSLPFGENGCFFGYWLVPWYYFIAFVKKHKEKKEGKGKDEGKH